MKKYIIAKIVANIIRNEPARSEVQPPLPLEPPPPDENYTLHIKQEIVDDEYESSTLSELLNEPVNSDKTTPIDAKISKVVICRDFVRGTCKRPGTCKYAHKYDLTQLVGVYTFCRKYQTSVCTYPVCKYVHATVFEEHHFYRTGILPPHAFAHHKKVNVMQPLPPPPPPPPPPIPKKHPTNLSVNTNVSMNLTFTNPPPPLQNGIFQEEMKNMVSPKSATLNKQWNSIEQFSGSPSDRDNNEPLAKKCKHCDIMDFRCLGNDQDNKCRPILIRFRYEDTRTVVWRKKTSLKGTNFVVAEFLTKQKQSWFVTIRKHLGVRNVWTQNGSIVIKVPSGGIKRISSQDELDFLLQQVPATAASSVQSSQLAIDHIRPESIRVKRVTNKKK